MAHVIHGLLLRPPTTLPPRGDFASPAKLITIVDDDGGEVYTLMAADEAADALDGAQTPCRAIVELRATPVDLGALSGGARRGKAWKLRAIRAKVVSEGAKR